MNIITKWLLQRKKNKKKSQEEKKIADINKENNTHLGLPKTFTLKKEFAKHGRITDGVYWPKNLDGIVSPSPAEVAKFKQKNMSKKEG